MSLLHNLFNKKAQKNRPVRDLMKKVYRKKPWNQAVTFIAATLVFITTYMLILPAITMTKPVLDCPYVVYQDPEAIILHQHDAACYNDNGDLICVLPERKIHVHDASCYEDVVLGYETIPLAQAIEEGRLDGAVTSGTVQDALFYDSVPAGENTVFVDGTGDVSSPAPEQVEDAVSLDVVFSDGELSDSSEIATDPNAFAQTISETISIEDLQSTENNADISVEGSQYAQNTLGIDDSQMVTVPIIEKHLICGREELNPEFHVHDDSCYETVIMENEDGSVTEGRILTCTKPVVFFHQHGEECFKKAGSDDIIVYEEPSRDSQDFMPQDAGQGIVIYDEPQVEYDTADYIDDHSQTVDESQIVEVPQDMVFPEGDNSLADAQKDESIIEYFEPSPVIVEQQSGIVDNSIDVSEVDSIAVTEDHPGNDEAPTETVSEDTPIVTEAALSVMEDPSQVEEDELSVPDGDGSVIDDVNSAAEEDSPAVDGVNMVVDSGLNPVSGEANATADETDPDNAEAVNLANSETDEAKTIEEQSGQNVINIGGDSTVRGEESAGKADHSGEETDEETDRKDEGPVIQSDVEEIVRIPRKIEKKEAGQTEESFETDVDEEGSKEEVSEAVFKITTEIQTETGTELTTESAAETHSVNDQIISEAATEVMSEIIIEADGETTTEVVNDALFEAAPEITTENITKITTEITTEAENEAFTETIETSSEKVSESVYEISTEITSEAGSESVTADYINEYTTEYFSEPITEYISGPTTEYVSESATEYISESATEYVSESTTENISEITTEADAESVSEFSAEMTTEAVSEPLSESSSEITTEAVNEIFSEAVTELTTESYTEASTEAAAGTTMEAYAEVSTEAASEITTEVAAEVSSEASTETTTELFSEASSEAPAEVTTAVFTFDGTDYHVHLTYDSNSGIPGDARLSVVEIDPDSEEYGLYLSQAKAALGLAEDATLPKEYARFFDITILDTEGSEIQPKNQVKVEIIYDQPVADVNDENVSASVLHFDEEKNAEVLATLETGVEEGVEVSMEGTGEAGMEESGEVSNTESDASTHDEVESDNESDPDNEAGSSIFTVNSDSLVAARLTLMTVRQILKMSLQAV